jgi:hypothetical protein
MMKDEPPDEVPTLLLMKPDSDVDEASCQQDPVK